MGFGIEYLKLRRKFGRPCNVRDVADVTDATIPTDNCQLSTIH
ncbi:hypothetical protein [Microcoleus sp. bin38.metabat.b11b12b14.051]|nr:hypothetical protein [Microcoleus sp. bin38.metabat.b11b12b14.051]